MSELTKQYFDKQVAKLATKEEIRKLATKEDIENVKSFVEIEIKGLETKLETKIENEVAELARMTQNGFEEIKREFNVKDQVDNLDRRMYRIEQSLNIKN